jgi:hypothetical protein
MLLVSGSDLEIDTEQRAKLLSQQHRLEREGIAKETMRAHGRSIHSVLPDIEIEYFVIKTSHGFTIPGFGGMINIDRCACCNQSHATLM